MKRRRLDVNIQELDQIVDSAGEKPLADEDRNKLKTAIHAMAERLMEGYRTSERTDRLADRQKERDRIEGAKQKRGHGRLSASDYTGAARVDVPHPTLSSGCPCPDPDCPGKVYALKEASPRLLITGMQPVQGTVYNLQKVRCNVCEQVYTAPEPEGVGPDKYDETVASMVAVFKYGLAIPFTRLEALQKHFGVPFPASTQWEVVAEAAELVRPAYEELQKQAAQGETVHTDDTMARILDVDRPADDKRTGLHTTGVVSVLDEGRHFVALYFTGIKHAGENLADLLALRPEDAPAPVLMHDALSWNTSKLTDAAKAFIANCLAHGRRQIVDQFENFPTECLYVLDELGKVFLYDKKAREQKLNMKERLKYHQENSGPVMTRLHTWLKSQLDENRTEPNSGLGKAFKYLLTHWAKLTLFLRHPGAPLENNICERALKKAVLHRKNALFYRTLNGAQVGDLFMSLIHTCELNKVNPFEYLNELQRHAVELRQDPSAWMPWNYKIQVDPSPPPG
jgi:transposase